MNLLHIKKHFNHNYAKYQQRQMSVAAAWSRSTLSTMSTLCLTDCVRMIRAECKTTCVRNYTDAVAHLVGISSDVLLQIAGDGEDGQLAVVCE